MIAIITISWLLVIGITLKDLFSRNDIESNKKIVWLLFGLVPVIGLLTYGFINFKRNRNVLIAIVLAIITSATAFWYFAIYEQKNNRTDVTNKQAVTKTATDFVQEFLTNEEAANKKYLQKDSSVIEMNGTVEKIEKDELGTILYLQTNIEGTTISCRLQEATNLIAGNEVTIKGIFTGFLMGQIQLSECKIISGKAANTTALPETKVVEPQPKDSTIKNTSTTKDTVALAKVQAKNYNSVKGQIRFYSKTPAEDIEATNTQIVSKITDKGAIEFAALIKGFRFENELMQKHFNEEGYLHSDKYPKSEYKGIITNFASIDLTKNATHNVSTTGKLTLKGVTKNINATGTLTVKDGKVQLNSVFKLRVQDYNIDGSDVAEQLEITVSAEYK